MKKIFKFIKKPLFFIPAIIIVIILASVLLGGNKKATYEATTVARGNVIQEVSVTGRVQPVESVDLAFERNGKVSSINIAIGDKVEEGKILSSLDNQELAAQLLQAQAGLEAERAKLSEMIKGTRLEEIQAAETRLSNAQTSFTNTQNKAAGDLEGANIGSVNAGQAGVTVAKNALLTLTDIQLKYFTDNSFESQNLASLKAVAIKLLLGVDNGGTMVSSSIGSLSGGAFGGIQTIIDTKNYYNLVAVLGDVINAMQKVRDALNAVPISNSMTVAEKGSLATEKTSIETYLSSVSGKKEALAAQKITNDMNIAAAQSELSLAQDNLALKKAGYTTEQIQAEEAQVKSSEANVLAYQAQLSKTIIRAPFNGIVTKQDAKVGEIITANVSVISLISDKKFEIEVNIPESDVAKIKVNNSARVTLDAYGDDVEFQAQVVSIEPAETIFEGIATYKTKLNFLTDDERIRSGMTANIDILTNEKKDVIVVPQRAVIQKDENRIVRVVDVNGKIIERKVEIGLKGSDGNVEIISGLNVGDQAIVFMKEN
ncbi:MAG TPA: efflux RND transporter periplasmic adaptor subunit [Candidatus Paceibacterota bacterium]|nr:efflux RND transporter periplasmic adaptor subunit [Candidatus Paceibacterota bacterium]HPT40162.1 efflux RND transporter periplasmic adaptor subunit [Candidatus Paceibacterota bacterium]